MDKPPPVYLPNPSYSCIVKLSSLPFIHVPFSLIYNPPQFLPSGTPIMTVIAWGGMGASVVMLTWHRDRGGSAIRLPWGHYDPCVWR